MKRIARSHELVVPLCRAHHQHDYGAESVERLSHAGFTRRFGVDLLVEAKELRRRWDETDTVA